MDRGRRARSASRGRGCACPNDPGPRGRARRRQGTFDIAGEREPGRAPCSLVSAADGCGGDRAARGVGSLVARARHGDFVRLGGPGSRLLAARRPGTEPLRARVWSCRLGDCDASRAAEHGLARDAIYRWHAAASLVSRFASCLIAPAGVATTSALAACAAGADADALPSPRDRGLVRLCRARRDRGCTGRAPPDRPVQLHGSDDDPVRPRNGDRGDRDLRGRRMGCSARPRRRTGSPRRRALPSSCRRRKARVRVRDRGSGTDSNQRPSEPAAPSRTRLRGSPARRLADWVVVSQLTMSSTPAPAAGRALSADSVHPAYVSKLAA